MSSMKDLLSFFSVFIYSINIYMFIATIYNGGTISVAIRKVQIGMQKETIHLPLGMMYSF